jgi:hypothetical protein
VIKFSHRAKQIGKSEQKVCLLGKILRHSWYPLAENKRRQSEVFSRKVSAIKIPHTEKILGVGNLKTMLVLRLFIGIRAEI